MVGHHGVVDVQRTLRSPRGAAGEVQQRRVLRLGARDLRLGGTRGEQRVQRGRVVLTGGAAQQHVPQARHPITDGPHLAPIQRRRRDQDGRLAEGEPLPHGLGTERREQRRDHTARLQRPEHRDVEVRDPAQQREHPLTLAHAEVAQHRSEPVRALGEAGVGELGDPARSVDPAQRRLPSPWALGVPVHRLVRDVQPAAAQAGHGRPRRGPVEVAARRRVVTQVRSRANLGRLADRCPVHVRTRSCGSPRRGRAERSRVPGHKVTEVPALDTARRVIDPGPRSLPSGTSAGIASGVALLDSGHP